MSITTYTIQHVSAVIDTDLKEIGSRVAPVSTTLTGEVQEVKRVITNSSGDNYNLVTMWLDTVGPLADFDICAIYSDAAILVEFAIDLAGTPLYATHGLAAGELLILTTDDGLFGTALADGSATTTDTIERIRVKNNADGSSTSVTANVRMVLYT